MPTPLTEIEIENRKKVLLEHLAKTGQKVPKAFMGLNMQTIYDSPGIQQAIAEGTLPQQSIDAFKAAGVDTSGAVTSASSGFDGTGGTGGDGTGGTGGDGTGGDGTGGTGGDGTGGTGGTEGDGSGTKDTTHVRYQLAGLSPDNKTYIRHSLNAAGEIIGTDYPVNPKYNQIQNYDTVSVINNIKTIVGYNEYGDVIETMYVDATTNQKVDGPVNESESKRTEEQMNVILRTMAQTKSSAGQEITWENVLNSFMGSNLNDQEIYNYLFTVFQNPQSPLYAPVQKLLSYFKFNPETGQQEYIAPSADDGTEGEGTEGDGTEGDGTEGDGTGGTGGDGTDADSGTEDTQEPVPEGYELKYQLPQNDGSFIYVYVNAETGDTITRRGPAATGISDLVFNPNDPRGYTAQMALDPAIPERGIFRYQDQVYQPGTEEMRGTVGGVPIYDADGKVIGFTPGDKSAFLKTQTTEDIPTAQQAGSPILNAQGEVIGYSAPQATGPAQRRPIYDAQGNITGYTAGMEAAQVQARQIGVPVLGPDGSIISYTNQVSTEARQRLQPVRDDAGTITSYTADAALTREITAPKDTVIDPVTGQPVTTRPAPSAGALITAEEANLIASTGKDKDGNVINIEAEINAADLPNRVGMIADEVTIVRDDEGNIIGAIPAGAEIPTAAKIQELGREAFDLLKETDIPQATLTKAEDTGREQEDVTTQETVAAQLGTDPDKLKGAGIIERAVGKDTEDLSPTEIAQAKAVAQTTDIIGELFPQAVQGNVQALDTVRGQLASLMADFDDGTPDWAAGSIRVANQAMAERGLGNSSIAAATIVQAAQEAALPIAQADAQIYANMNLTNISNQNKFALDNAAAARNFKLADLSNKQQAELANSTRAFNFLDASLSNYQAAMVANAQMSNALQEQDLSRSQQEQIANAARYSELENMNLTHDQQRRLTDATNQLQVDLANLSTKEKAVLAELQVQAALEGQELSNIQQTNVLKATRYAEANNLDFTAEQNRVFQNSKIVETLALDDLEFEQARTLQNAARYATMDTADLNNRQQAQVENARNFLQMDLANLSNSQQAAMLDAQGLQQFMLTDTAAENAARTFNAQSENQVNQFFEQVTADISKYNANLMAAMQQYNAGQENAMAQYNATMANQREQFNSAAALEIEQANVNYRRELNTLNTAGANLEAQGLAQNYFNLSQRAMDNIWQDYRDTINYAFNQAQNDKDRTFNLGMALMQRDQENKMFADTVDFQTGMALGNMAIGLLATISDVRLKENIVKQKEFSNGLGWYKWDWNDTAKELGFGKRPVEGFIAQEVEKLYPDTIIEKECGYKAIMFEDVLRRSEDE